jgi:threonine dehydrogenase-like Zn-dependent dehydrogenase
VTANVKFAEAGTCGESGATTARREDLRVPPTMKAWILRGPGELGLADKPVPAPGVAEVLVRVDAVAVCGTDIEVIGHGDPALVQGGTPFDKNFTPGHEYMGTVAALMGQQRFPAKLIHTHTFGFAQVPTAIRYAAERVEDAIKVVVKIHG